MDLALLVYGISVVNNINVIVGILFLATTITTIISAITYYVSEYDSDLEISKRALKWSTVALSITALLGSVIPGEKTMYTMVGAYAAQKVSEDPKAQQLSAKVLKLVESKLDTYIAEATTKQGK